MLLFSAAVVLGTVLVACAPVIAPIGIVQTAPRITNTHFVTSDGYELPVRAWLTAERPEAVVLAVHGFNDYSKAFDTVPNSPGAGPYLASNNVAVYSYDQRGFGEAPNFGFWPGVETMARDFVDFSNALKEMYPNVPLIALGESMGGAVVTVALAADGSVAVEAGILVAPAVWGRSTMPVGYRVALWLGAHTLPWARPTGRGFVKQASDNSDMLRDNSRDPLFIKETRIDAVWGLANLMDRALISASKIEIPILLLYGENDEIIPTKSTLEVISSFLSSNNRFTLAVYPNGWHMLLRDRNSSVVLGDVLSFIKHPESRLPSNADMNALTRLQKTTNSP